MPTLLIKANLGIRMCQISGLSASCKGPLHLPPHLVLHNSTVTILLSTFWLYCHLPFVAEKLLYKHNCFLLRENDTLPPALCCRENVIAFCWGKMIHCYLPFVAEKMLHKHKCFPLRETDTPPSTLYCRENVMWAQLLSVKGKWYTATCPLSQRIRF